MISPLRVLNLGPRPYEDVWTIQREIQRALIEGHGEDTLLLCEHDPVITAGTSGDISSLKIDQELLQRHGVRLIRTERGGNVTYHGPGQLIAYPLLDLKKKRRDVHWYMRGLERVIIELLSSFGVESMQVPERTGVWTKPIVNAIDFAPRKIASIGVRISRWCTMHGLSLNVWKDPNAPDGFALIDPCGLQGVDVSWLSELAPQHAGPDLMRQAVELLPQVFCKEFGYELVRGV